MYILLLINEGCAYLGIVTFLVYLVISFEFYTIEEYLLSLPCGFMILFSGYNGYVDTHIASLFFYLIFYFIKLRSERLNERLQNLLANSGHVDSVRLARMADQLIEQHNSICRQTKSFNKFWSKYLLYILISLMPLNLFLLHQVMFKEMQAITLLFNCFMVGLSWIFIFLVSFFASLVPKSMKLTAKKLFKLQMIIDSRSSSGVRTKLKILSAFEMNSTSIGFSVGLLFLMTKTTFSKVTYVNSMFIY